MTNLAKAKGFERVQNWPQTLHHAELAATKLKQLKDRPVEVIDDALSLKYDALLFMIRYRECLECAKEWYSLWPRKYPHSPAIIATFSLVESCTLNNEFIDAAFYARILWETIILCRYSDIPHDERELFTARGAMALAQALWKLAENGDMPAEEQQEAGAEAIMLARRALEINTQLYGGESDEVACDMGTLAGILNHFNDIDDDEVPRLYEQSKAIRARVHGSMSSNVAACEKNLGNAYYNRANRAQAVHELDREVANLELALPRCREAARIYRALNHVDHAESNVRNAIIIEEKLRKAVDERAAASRG